VVLKVDSTTTWPLVGVWRVGGVPARNDVAQRPAPLRLREGVLWVLCHVLHNALHSRARRLEKGRQRAAARGGGGLAFARGRGCTQWVHIAIFELRWRALGLPGCGKRYLG
jgi:hypothetical protein